MTASRWFTQILVICVAAGVSFAVSSAISSKQPASGPRCQMGQTGHNMGACMVTDYLNLSSEQQSRVSEITGRFCAAQVAESQEMQVARTRLLDAIKAPHPKRGDIDAALSDLATTQAEMQRHTAEYLLELKPVLTDDQQKKLFDLVGQRFREQGKCGGGACPGMGMPGCGMRSGCPK